MAVKLIAFAALLEYTFLRPYIIPKDPDGYESTDFIGFSVVMAVLAIFGEIALKGLPQKSHRTVLRNGLFGGLLGYAWLLVYIRYPQRRMHHLLVANFMTLVGVIYGSWNERRKKRSTRWR